LHVDSKSSLAAVFAWSDRK